MDQALINIVLAVAGFFVALWVNSVRSDHKDLHKAFTDHKEKAVIKDDFNLAVSDLKRMLERLFEKLDGKADK